MCESEQGEDNFSLGCNVTEHHIITSLLFKMEIGSSYISSWRQASHGFGPELRKNKKKQKTICSIFFYDLNVEVNDLLLLQV